MIPIRFLPPAREEFIAAIQYYDEQQPGLGARFTQAVEEAVARTLEHPRSGPKTFRATRRMLVENFPYTVIYRASEAELLVVAVAHQRRRRLLAAPARVPLSLRPPYSSQVRADSSASGASSRWASRMRTTVFQRRMASSLPRGRISAALSKLSRAWRNQP